MKTCFFTQFFNVLLFRDQEMEDLEFIYWELALTVNYKWLFKK